MMQFFSLRPFLSDAILTDSVRDLRITAAIPRVAQQSFVESVRPTAILPS